MTPRFPVGSCSFATLFAKFVTGCPVVSQVRNPEGGSTIRGGSRSSRRPGWAQLCRWTEGYRLHQAPHHHSRPSRLLVCRFPPTSLRQWWISYAIISMAAQSPSRRPCVCLKRRHQKVVLSRLRPSHNG